MPAQIKQVFISNKTFFITILKNPVTRYERCCLKIKINTNNIKKYINNKYSTKHELSIHICRKIVYDER